MDQRLFYLLNMARHRVYKFADKHAENELGVSITQLGALLLLQDNEGCLLKDIAKALGLNNSAVTGLGNRLEQNGYVIRKPCAQDGRAFRLYLTKLGKDKVLKAKPLIQQLNQAICADFSDEEIKVIVKFLTHLMRHFEA